MNTVKVLKVTKIAKPDVVCDIGVCDNHNMFVSDGLYDDPELVS